ncbi:oxidoreductase HTATIP2 [Clonorchis sinensis]|uniref:Oxidoreductase HTATIP2 n=2 Tax=Clonorchis sinensis TaxID=79923 RepID=G7YLU0_CLOSI|nr:oxidoreductase HTATIP2 [Clonorchis sinensis]
MVFSLFQYVLPWYFPPILMSVLLRAFVVGYTGETGKALVKALAKDSRYDSVTLIGRRQVDKIDYGVESHVAEKKFSQHVLDFEKLDDHALLFSDADVGFVAIGTTLQKSGRERMRVVDHDYVIKIAELSLASGCKELHVVSSQGANPKSSLFYSRLKGETEEDLKSVGVFPNYLAIYRPGVLLCNRTEFRFGERLYKILMKPIHSLYPRWLSVPVTTLAQAMVNAPFCLASIMRKKARDAGDAYDPKVLIVSNDQLFDLAAESDDNFS